MNYKIKPYHFTKNIDKNFIVFFEKVENCDGIICFDFEDSISSSKQNQTNFLKNSHRESIIKGLKDISSRIKLTQIGFRINGTETINYNNDIKAISILGNVNCVFLPKVENYKQVEKLLKDISQSVIEIIPIIETNKGFENIKEILSLKDSRFIRIAFGHCDFNLSNKYFPFFHQNTAEYWNWIKQLVYYTKFAGKQIINSPLLNLEDEEYFSKVLFKNKSFDNITGQITLCLKQTLLCYNIKQYPDLSLIYAIKNNYNKLEIASEIIKKFEEYKIDNRFFAIDEKRVLISPQEYELAKKVLKKNDI